MTPRTHLDQRVRWFSCAMYTCLALIITGILAGVVLRGEPHPAVVLPGVALGVVGLVAHFGGLLCPRCRGNLAPVVLYQGWPFAVSPRVRFCPYCGAGMDDELPDQQRAASSHDTK